MVHKISLKVTRKHILEGLHANCLQCPVALAFGDIGMEVSVTSEYFRTIHPAPIKYYKLPPELQKIVRTFDAYKNVEPVEYTFELEEYDA